MKFKLALIQFTEGSVELVSFFIMLDIFGLLIEREGKCIKNKYAWSSSIVQANTADALQMP